jgi:flagellar hook-basal body complex protein FliE
MTTIFQPAAPPIAVEPHDRPSPSVGSTTGSRAASFEDGLAAIVSSTDGVVKAADQLVEKGVRGKADLHEVALALEEADVSMRLMMKARNKVVEAYQEVMRMAI